ncbi:hypothetical protein FACS1894158_02330 [Betaproteobacteria bacterium]|nr:hypothetical protein FACS1894158_02330 [Betaproteobacteria bacterium]
MEIVLKKYKEKSDGCIFAIPLFLPDWTIRKGDDLINYGSYKWNPNDTYAFARLIETTGSNADIVEIFSYAGSVPENPDAIIKSGRLFYPAHVVMHHSKKRWPIVFIDTEYDKVRDSEYGKFGFLLMTQLYIGGEYREIGMAEADRRRAEGTYPNAVIHSPTQLEVKVRKALAESEFEYDYRADALRHLDGLPKPRKKDASFNKKIAPFRLVDLDGVWSICLEGGDYKQDVMEQKGLLGNGYDWEKTAQSFIAVNMPEITEALSFDSEAGMFSVKSKNKAHLKRFAEAFKVACEERQI